MKSILLSTLNAKYIHSSLALRYLQAFCQAHNCTDINIKEFTINEALEDILAAIYLEKPEILCFSCYIWNIKPILELVADYKKLSPKTIIILGGPEVSYDAGILLLANPGVDFIVRGEGEASLHELLLVLEEELDSGNIQGISYRQGEDIYHNPDRALINDLDSIPFPYPLDLTDFKDKIVYYESSRGCPFNCSYCLSSTQHGVRFFSMERVKQDLAVLAVQELREIKFVDRTFNCHEERALEIMRWVIELQAVTKFHFEMEAALLSTRMLDFLQTVPAGKFNLEIGIQSTFQPALQAVQRKSDWKTVRDNIKRLKSYNNLHLHLDLIAGLPFETYQDFARSFNDVYRLQADVLQLGFLKLLKGSALRDLATQYGYIYQEQPPYQVLTNKYIDYAEMIKLKQIEDLLDKYHNSADMSQSIAYIIGSIYDNDAFGFFEDFSRYWQVRDLFSIGHKKEIHYEILIDFVKEKDSEQAEIVNDLLKYDYIMNNRNRLPDCMWSYNPDDVNREIYSYIKDDNFRRLHLADKLAKSSREIRKNMHLEYFRYDPETALYSQELLKIVFIYDPVKKRVAQKIRMK